MRVGGIGVALGADHAVAAEFRAGPQPVALLDNRLELLLPAFLVLLGNGVGVDGPARPARSAGTVTARMIRLVMLRSFSLNNDSAPVRGFPAPGTVYPRAGRSEC